MDTLHAATPAPAAPAAPKGRDRGYIRQRKRELELEPKLKSKPNLGTKPLSMRLIQSNTMNRNMTIRFVGRLEREMHALSHSVVLCGEMFTSQLRSERVRVVSTSSLLMHIGYMNTALSYHTSIQYHCVMGCSSDVCVKYANPERNFIVRLVIPSPR